MSNSVDMARLNHIGMKRLLKGLSRCKLASIIGVTEQYIGQLENKKYANKLLKLSVDKAELLRLTLGFKSLEEVYNIKRMVKKHVRWIKTSYI